MCRAVGNATGGRPVSESTALWDNLHITASTAISFEFVEKPSVLDQVT